MNGQKNQNQDTQLANDIHGVLQKMVGMHRQLLEHVRLEREALVQADRKTLQEQALAKRGVVESINLLEERRRTLTLNLARLWQVQPDKLVLSEIILELQVRAPKLAESLRSTQNALRILVERVISQNESNRRLLETSVKHVDAMKKNILGEADPLRAGYNPSGQRGGPAQQGQARFLSREA
jgi:hypothetical protein